MVGNDNSSSSGGNNADEDNGHEYNNNVLASTSPRALARLKRLRAEGAYAPKGACNDFNVYAPDGGKGA